MKTKTPHSELPTKKVAKKRAAKYEPKVAFNGTFEDMIAISTTGAGAKPKKVIKKK